MAWLTLAGVLLAGFAIARVVGGEGLQTAELDSVRHIVAVGVVLSTIVGMAQMILPEFAGERLLGRQAAWRGMAFGVALTIATVLRAGARPLAAWLPSAVVWWSMSVAGVLALGVVAALGWFFLRGCARTGWCSRRRRGRPRSVAALEDERRREAARPRGHEAGVLLGHRRDPGNARGDALRARPAAGRGRAVPDLTSCGAGAGLQNGALVFILSWLGLRLGSAIGLDSPFARALVYGGTRPLVSRRAVIEVVVVGVIGTLVTIGLLIAINPWMPPATTPSALHVELWKRALTPIYGGIVEELLVRLGLMTVLAWIAWRVVGPRTGRPSSAVYWFAVVGAALLFGAGHLPAVTRCGR
ncbi:MAG: hypothetical protein U0360_00640 [Dehalococcoidia bacterium]